MEASTIENALRELVVERFLASWCDIGALEPPAYGQWQYSGLERSSFAALEC